MRRILLWVGACLLSIFFLTYAAPFNQVPLASAAPTNDAVVGNGTAASCNETNFNNALNTVQNSGGGTITFNCGGPATITFGSEKSITADVIIDGNNTITLSGGNTNRLFNVTANNILRLDNIILKNGYDDSFGGGAILNYGTVNLNGSTIRDSNVDPGFSGGAILSVGVVTMYQSLIENNSGGSVGGVFMLGAPATLAVTESTFRDNHTTNNAYGLGGAITLWDDAGIFLQDSILEQNQARQGGALFVHTSNSNTNLVIRDSILRMNYAYDSGGAVYTEEGTTSNPAPPALIQFDNTLIANNTASVGNGGGISNHSAFMIIDDSTIRDNQAQNGGGIANDTGILDLDSSTIYNNTAANYGGGIYSKSGNVVKLTNVTLSDNNAYEGGGMKSSIDTQVNMTFVTFNNNTATNTGNNLDNDASTINAKNIIFQSDSGNNCFGSAITSGGYNLASDASCNLTGTGDVQNTDAQLGPLQNNGGLTLTHLPKENSPAINNGQCVTGQDFDQRGYPRPQGGNCDKGSVERQPNDIDGLAIYLPAVLR